MAADERVTGFVERLAEKWTAEIFADVTPRARQATKRLLCEALTEAARVARQHPVMPSLTVCSDHGDLIARQIERLRDE